MIKGFGFGKLLKQLFIIPLISCFILSVGSFVSAEYLELNGSLNINSFDVELLPGTNFLSNSQYKVLQTSASYWRHTLFWNNGMLYIITSKSYRADINTNIISQGYMKGYCQKDIDPFTASSDTSTCDPSRGNNPSGIVMSLFYNSSQIHKNADGLYIEERGQQIRYCFDYYDIGKRNCFRYDVVESQGYFLTGTLNLTSNYAVGTDGFITDTLPYLENSVFGSVGGGNGGGVDMQGSINVGYTNSITGDYVSSNCTYQQIFDYANSFGYNDYLCFGGLNNFDLYSSTGNYNPVPLSGKTLGQILAYSNARDTPNDWFIFWNGLYLDRYNDSYNAMWESYPAVYRTWFDLYYRYGGASLNFDAVREYCAMKSLDIDFNTTYYKGQYFKTVCQSIQNGAQYGYDDVGTGESDNVVGVNWIGVGNVGSGNSGVNISNNPVVFIQDFFNKLKANFPTSYDLGGGFLPVYIIIFLCAIILFRFLSH